MVSLADIQHQFDDSSYAILDVIGEGGMGSVYGAKHRLLNRRVVIKVLKPHLDAAYTDRFRLEAQAAAQLQHDNIISVLDFGTLPNGSPFLVTEQLVGRSLEELLAEHERAADPIATQRALDITQQILAGLGYAHDRGLIHRDVKPANIFVCDDGRVKLLDFGVVKLTDPISGVAPLEAPTADGAVVGTPRYMAPEQARGRSVDGRADVYAVGIILYRMVAGVVPFGEHDTVAGLLRARCKTLPPPPSGVAAHAISKRLDEVIMRAIAIAPADRYKSAYEMAGAIYQLGTGFRQVALELGLEESDFGDGAPATLALDPPPPSTRRGQRLQQLTEALATKALDPTVIDRPQRDATSLEGAAEEPDENRFPFRTYVDAAIVSFVVTIAIGVMIEVMR